jgi:hypothetical protein
MRILILIAATVSAYATDNMLSAEEKKVGFKLLFDGHSMAGWRNPSTETPPGDAWIIEDGCLKTTPKPRVTEDLISADSFGDFELKFDWKLAARGNSGVKYRIQGYIWVDHSKAETAGVPFETHMEQIITHPTDRAKLPAGARGGEYPVSYEFQLQDDEGNKKELSPSHRQDTGALYAMIPPAAKAARAPGEWNESRLIVKGQHFEHWINGTKVLEGSLDSEEAREGTNRRWKNAPTIRNMLLNAKPTGPIGLQHHGAAVSFKNLKIRPL